MFSLTFKIIDHLELAVFPSETSMLLKNCSQCCVSFCHTTMRISHNYTCPLSWSALPSSTPPLQVITEHRTGLRVFYSFSPAIYFTYYMYVCWHHFLHSSHSLPPSLPHSVHKSVFYICVSVPPLQICLSIPLFHQLSSVAQSCPTLCNPMNRSTPGLPVYHRLPEFTQTRVHRVSDAIQPSHPRLSPSPPAPNPSQYQSLLQWVNSSHEVAKVLELHSALASFLPKKSRGWSPSEWTGWISLQSKGPSRVFSNTTVQTHQFFGAQPSSQSNSHIHTWPQEKP